jgi:hypothetical protein
VDGQPLRMQKSLRFSFHKGEKFIAGQWAVGGMGGWFDVMMNVVHIVHDPADIRKFRHDNVRHECAHYWLSTNRKIWGHDPKYDPILNWSQYGAYLIKGEQGEQ